MQEKQDGELSLNTRLLRYTREANIRPRQELKWKSPFEVFHGKPWRFKKEENTMLVFPSFVSTDEIKSQSSSSDFS